MGSIYIQADETEAYGVADLPAQVIAQASGFLDGFLDRPEGLQWMPDSNGWPCYMAALSSQQTFSISAGIAAGSTIAVSLPGLVGDDSLIGDVVILDRLVTGMVEACVIISFAPGVITLQTVQNTHAADCTLEFGLVISEDRYMPARRSVTRVSFAPIAKMLSGYGRYGYGRRSDQSLGYSDDINLLASLGAIGGPPAWESFMLSDTSINRRTGEVWVPSGMLLAYFTEVRLRYIAGYSYAGLPTVVKQATATIAESISAKEMPGNVIRARAGQQEIQRAVSTVLDADTIMSLRGLAGARLI